MLNWLSEINFYQKKEKEEHLNRLVQLATVSQDNSPRVRTVVFRGWTKFNEMIVISDNRSKKIEEIKSNNYVEICWFFPTSMCQFRLRGRLNIDMSEDTTLHWNLLDDQARSMWGWPTPGAPVSKDKYKLSKSQFDNFILLKIDISYVEQLIIKRSKHIRKRWIRNKDWIEEYINP